MLIIRYTDFLNISMNIGDGEIVLMSVEKATFIYLFIGRESKRT